MIVTVELSVTLPGFLDQTAAVITAELIGLACRILCKDKYRPMITNNTVKLNLLKTCTTFVVMGTKIVK